MVYCKNCTYIIACSYSARQLVLTIGCVVVSLLQAVVYLVHLCLTLRTTISEPNSSTIANLTFDKNTVLESDSPSPCQ